MTSDPLTNFFRILTGGAGEKFTFYFFLLFSTEKVKNGIHRYKLRRSFTFLLFWVGVAFFFVDPEGPKSGFLR